MLDGLLYDQDVNICMVRGLKKEIQRQKERDYHGRNRAKCRTEAGVRGTTGNGRTTTYESEGVGP